MAESYTIMSRPMEDDKDVADSSPNSTTHRLLYINCPPSRLFRSHWSIFLPSNEGSEDRKYKGRRIHVTGDVRNGFETRFVRNADLDNGLTGKPRIIPIAWIARESCTLDGIDHSNEDGDMPFEEEYEDTQPRDILEDLCMQIPAPGPSLRSVKTGGSESALKMKSSNETPEPEESRVNRKELRDCQWWIRQVLASLQDQGRILPLREDESVMLKLDQVPQH